MRPPDFWMHERGRASAPMLRMLLSPVSALYAFVVARRLERAPARVSVPVICVGNVTLGGTGKTPVVRAIGAMLEQAGIATHVLLRGHGGRERGPLRVTAAQTSADVGDEALLHAADRPTWIARDRAAGARAAVAAGARAIVMDDGFQNPSLAKDFSILVFDAETGIGAGRVFPSGPLREPLAAALKRADLVVMMHPRQSAQRPDWLTAWAGPLVHAWLEPASPPPAGPLIAFAGIGRPEKFFATLKAAGGDISEAIPFPDHHVFTASDRALLDAYAKERGAKLITTEKDYARLPPDWRARVATLPVHARFADEAGLRAALQPILARAGEAG